MARERVSSGIGYFDKVLGGLYIGDNVIWYDSAGGVASVFAVNFIQSSLEQNKSVVYVSFDKSPKNLWNRFGSLVEHPNFVMVDCFTNGKGSRADIFESFYIEHPKLPFRIVRVEDPSRPEELLDVISRLYKEMETALRFVFETLTGMQDLWGGEDIILKFYGHACPRLYELNTIAYWIVDKAAHSDKLKARLNHITQVAIELSINRDRMYLTILKAEDRPTDMLSKTLYFSIQENNIIFESDLYSPGKVNMGTRLMEIRRKRGISQKELAQMIGVTPSTISQLESNRIYPSIPALIKIAEILGVEVGYFFGQKVSERDLFVFPETSRIEIKLNDFPEDSIRVYLLVPLDVKLKAEPYIIEIPPGKTLNAHFFIHKGEELGYVLKGKLQIVIRGTVKTISKGDVISLSSDVPSQWKNIGQSIAQMLWIKVN